MNRNNSHECKDCGRKFTRKVQYQKHVLQHAPEPEVIEVSFECDVCGKIFKSKKALSLHKPKHKIIKKNQIACVLCGKTFSQARSLNSHLRVHGEVSSFDPESREYDCKMCGKRFISKNDLNKHRIACHEDKPFSCNICNEHFQWRDQVSSHYCAPKHENKEPEDLQSTSSITTRNIDLIQLPELNSEAKSISCSLCNRVFSQKGHLILHYRRTHKRELLIENL